MEEKNLNTQVSEENAGGTVTDTQSGVEEQNKSVVKEDNNNASHDDDNDEDIDFDDSDDLDDDDSQQDENNQNNNNNNNQQHKQSRAENKKFAQARREAKKNSDELSAYQKGVKETLGGVNPYTKQEIKNSEDVEVYLTMKEMESKGLDPTDTADYIKYTREKNAEKIQQEEAARAEQERKISYQNEISSFKAKYPDVDIEKLVDSDKVWGSVILSQVRNGVSILDAYENALNLINAESIKRAQAMADKNAKEQVQNSMSAVGSMQDGEDGTVAKVDVNKMSEKDFADYWERRKHTRTE